MGLRTLRLLLRLRGAQQGSRQQHRCFEGTSCIFAEGAACAILSYKSVRKELFQVAACAASLASGTATLRSPCASRHVTRLARPFDQLCHFKAANFAHPISSSGASCLPPSAAKTETLEAGNDEALSEEQFHKVADTTLNALDERWQALLEDVDIDGSDIDYAQGVITLTLGRHGTYVLNKQTPNRQIWMSSPISGPFRYDFIRGRWRYRRDGRDMLHQLQEELSTIVGQSVELE